MSNWNHPPYNNQHSPHWNQQQWSPPAAPPPPPGNFHNAPQQNQQVAGYIPNQQGNHWNQQQHQPQQEQHSQWSHHQQWNQPQANQQGDNWNQQHQQYSTPPMHHNQANHPQQPYINQSSHNTSNAPQQPSVSSHVNVTFENSNVSGQNHSSQYNNSPSNLNATSTPPMSHASSGNNGSNSATATLSTPAMNQTTPSPSQHASPQPNLLTASPPQQSHHNSPTNISPATEHNQTTQDTELKNVEVGVYDNKTGQVVHKEDIAVEEHGEPSSFDNITSKLQGVLDALGCSFIPINILRRKSRLETDDDDYEIIVTSQGIISQKKASAEAKAVENSTGEPTSKDASRTSLDQQQMEEIAQEHVQSRLNPLAFMSSIERVYGLGIFMYFDFIRYIIFINTILLLLQAVNYIIHWIVDVKNMTSRSFSFFGWMYFIISSSQYSNSTTSVSFFSTQLLWRVTNIVAIVITFIFGPLYFLWATLLFRRRRAKDTENLTRHTSLDVIKENLKVHMVSRVLRRLAVFLLIVFMLALQFGAVFGLTKLQLFFSRQADQSSQNVQDTVTFLTNTGISVLISVSVVVLNILFRTIGVKLTQFEKYKTWTGFKQSNLLKLVSFKVMNVFIVGLAKMVDTGNQCPLSLIGQQYLILMLVDVLLMNILDLLKPILNRIFWGVMSTVRNTERMASRNSDAELKPEFNVAEEYLELVYRQYLIYLSMPAFPLAPLFGFVGGFAELFVDRVKLLKLSRKPPMTRSSMKSALSFFLLFTAFMAAVNPGSGNVYLLRIFPYWCDGSNCASRCSIFA